MAKLDCHFFPDTPAAWVCENCHTHYGEKCIPAGHSSHWGKVFPRCIRCNNNLRYLGSATGAKPFWQMLPHFFAYPLHTNSLLVIGGIALLTLFVGWGLLSLFLALLAAAVVVKYGFAIIEQRGSGATRPPEVSAVIAGDEDHLFLKQIAVLVLMGFAVTGAAQLGEIAGLLVAGFMTLAMPASTMLLAVEKSVGRALNPLALLALMLAVGWPYLLLWLCVQIISAGPVYIVDGLIAVLPEGMILPALACLMVYFSFVLYTMLGYVLFEYQSELGFESVSEDDADEMDFEDFEKARVLGEMAVLLNDGEYQRARETLRKALDQVPDDIELHMQYHKLLMLLDDDRALANHGEYLLALLQRKNRLEAGVPVFLDVQQRLPQFQLDDGQLALALARKLRMQGKHRELIRLFHNYHKRKPEDPVLPAAYLLVAQAFFEYLNDEAKALAISQFILKKFPDCAERKEFLKLRQAIREPVSPDRPG